MPILITAGATRNPIDAVRYLSAHSTGQTGVTLAHALLTRGAEVHLLGSAEAHLRGAGLDGPTFTSTRDLMGQLNEWVRQHPTGAIIHAAAVGDYEMARPTHSKITSGADELVLRLRPCPKILDQIRGWGHSGRLISFKAASPEVSEPELITIAKAQRARTQSDWVFANVLGRLESRVLLMGERPTFYDKRQDGLAALVEATLV